MDIWRYNSSFTAWGNGMSFIRIVDPTHPAFNLVRGGRITNFS